MADFNILTPDALNDLIYTPFQQAIGEAEHQRLQTQYRNYLYYDGYQHKGASDELVRAQDVPRPPGLDYDPTRYVSNYARLLVKKKANWQMNGDQSIDARARQIDKNTHLPNYTPSTEQQREYDRAEALEAIINQLRRENNAKARLIQAARDRLIAGRVACEIMFNQRTGKLRWIWHPDTETFPIFSEDDFEELIGINFVKQLRDDEGQIYYRKRTLEMNEEDGECYLSEGYYDENLDLIKTITPKASNGLSFIPAVLIPIEDLAGEPAMSKEFDDIMALSSILNQMNEDAIDSLKFEMFGITAVINATPGTAAKMDIAPGSVVELNGSGETQPDLKKVEGGFRWSTAFDAQYNRVKSAMHELTGIPQSVLNDLNFGGMNNDAMQIVFHDIIQDTQEHWLSWGPRLVELHEKSIRYLQARASTSKVFGYDRDKLDLIGENYEHDVLFSLPLPDNRSDLIELLTLEMDAGLESQSGALARAGVENTAGKKAEIEAERKRAQVSQDPYGDTEGQTV